MKTEPPIAMSATACTHTHARTHTRTHVRTHTHTLLYLSYVLIYMLYLFESGDVDFREQTYFGVQYVWGAIYVT